MSGGVCEGREMCASRFLRHVCSSGDRECSPPNADASLAVFSIDDISNRLGAAMDPLGVRDPNQGNEPTGARGLSRRTWLAMVGAAGLASLGGCGLVAGLSSPDPRWTWTPPLPGQADVWAAAADDSTLYAYVLNDGGAPAVAALDSTTGVERWSTRLDSPFRGGGAMIPAGEALVIDTPDMISVRDSATGTLRWQIPGRNGAVDVADGVVVSGSTEDVVTLDLRTGDRIWSADLRERDTTTTAMATGSGRSVTIGSSAAVAAHNGMCFSVKTHSFAYERPGVFGVSRHTWIDARDLHTGQVAWSTEFENGSSSDAWVRAAGDLVVARDSGSIVVVDAATGHRRWDGLGGRFVVAGDVLVRLYENGGYAEVHGLDLADGTKRWSLQDLDASDEDAENAVVHIVGGDGIVYIGEPDEPPVALDAASGSKLWTYRGQRHNATATVIAAHGRAVYLAAGGQIEAITTT
jgi:outer membrane protein assembly factor BamB